MRGCGRSSASFLRQGSMSFPPSAKATCVRHFRCWSDYLHTRPVAAERAAISLLVRLMERNPTPVHIVHLSSAGSLEIVGEARARGLPLTVETCPHYLTFAAEEIPEGAIEYKCAPPIRDAAEREALWRGEESHRFSSRSPQFGRAREAEASSRSGLRSG